ncbi:hypothetical protein [Lacticaseibacillus rhamnosus]|uniref:hypothetical protein n=1 Tax=Lacticaseibacillus rhamnosus TaxID=47715 RepID=UPI00067D8C18|nr:hypothetical protein [Lacticaseibacillus rhamnosus]
MFDKSGLRNTTIITEHSLQSIVGGGMEKMEPTGIGGLYGGNIFNVSDLPIPVGQPYYGSANQYRFAGRHYARN